MNDSKYDKKIEDEKKRWDLLKSALKSISDAEDSNTLLKVNR